MAPRARQQGMFDEDKRREIKEHLEAEYEGIKEELGKVDESGKFFKLFAAFATDLSDLTIQDIDDVLDGSIDFALFECDKLRCTLELLKTKVGSAKNTRSEITPL